MSATRRHIAFGKTALTAACLSLLTIACSTTTPTSTSTSDGDGRDGDGPGTTVSGSALRILAGQIVEASLYNNTLTVYPTTICADGGNGYRNYTFSLPASTNPPVGFGFIGGTGVFKRTATGAPSVTASRFIRVEVTDGSSTAQGDIYLRLNVTGPIPSAPVFQQFIMPEFTLVDAVANKPYGASLFVMSGTPPYSWSLDNTYVGGMSLASTGLNIDAAAGMVRGTSFNSASGTTIRFRVIVRDNTGAIALGNPVYVIHVK